jgi:DNA-directed RNA polymerase subunit beta
MKRGDELPSGVLQMVKVYVATKRVRFRSAIRWPVATETRGLFPRSCRSKTCRFLPDGTPLQIMLNPLGVPSRMNVGQILETHLGWAGAKLGFQAVTPVFDGASEDDIKEALEKPGLPEDGKARLIDGRTGEPMEQRNDGGLHLHAEAAPLGRRQGACSQPPDRTRSSRNSHWVARLASVVSDSEKWKCGRWKLTVRLTFCRNLLTVKSDDVEGRTKIYESMVKGENTLEAGTPASFDVLTNEIRGLGFEPAT